MGSNMKCFIFFFPLLHGRRQLFFFWGCCLQFIKCKKVHEIPDLRLQNKTSRMPSLHVCLETEMIALWEFTQRGHYLNLLNEIFHIEFKWLPYGSQIWIKHVDLALLREVVIHTCRPKLCQGSLIQTSSHYKRSASDDTIQSKHFNVIWESRSNCNCCKWNHKNRKVHLKNFLII